LERKAAVKTGEFQGPGYLTSAWERGWGGDRLAKKKERTERQKKLIIEIAEKAFTQRAPWFKKTNPS